jgi:hypothetical protein
MVFAGTPTAIPHRRISFTTTDPVPITEPFSILMVNSPEIAHLYYQELSLLAKTNPAHINRLLSNRGIHQENKRDTP